MCRFFIIWSIMATRKRSELEEERMTDANIAKVIQLLEHPEEGTKPPTKKWCCEFLGMAYNTTRLGDILEKYKEKKARTAERRAALRGKPATSEEITYIIQEYLEGGTVDSISTQTYRPAPFVKRVLEDNSVPMRQPGSSYFRPQLIPDGAARDKFTLGEIVYSARYESLALIDSESKSKDGLHYVYRLWLLAEKWKQYCYQPAYELASLEHLRTIGVKV